MLYPVYIHLGDHTHAHGVTIPDFPGCFSAVDNWDDFPRMIQEAIELYCDGEEMTLPKPSSMEQLVHNENYQDGIWMMLDIDVSMLNLKPVRLNISIPAALLSRIDSYSCKNKMTRSAFFAIAAQERMNQVV